MEWSSRSSSWRRTYQCCQGPACPNWIWEDKICEGYVCRQCGLAWSRPPQGYSSHPSSRRSPTRSQGRFAPRQKPVTPPPGLGGHRSSKIGQVHKATTDLLTTSWSSLDSKLQAQLEQLGIKPPAQEKEPELTDVLKENMAQLPTAVRSTPPRRPMGACWRR